jgi:eukaryotic-like serine/threonine-protein kinase
VPDVYVFRKTADATLPMSDAERRRQAQTQLDALEAFWSEWFRSEKGEFKAAFQNFTTTDSFEQQIAVLLRQWLETRGFLGPRIAWPKEKGSPFRGLAPFEAEHAAVFFGRARVTDEARRRLVGAAERGSPFLLIVGASGSGKSSLARAGLIPRLTTPGVVASVDLWRVARMKPGEGQAGPVMALATALLATDALPELAHGDYPTAASTADNLRRGGTASVQPITSALTRVAEDAVLSAAFSPDGTRIVTASGDKTARLWDAETGKPIGEPLTGHAEGVWSAAFSPDGKRVVTASWDKTGRLWEISANTQELVSHAKAVIPRCLTPAQRNAFFLSAEPPQWCIELEKWPYHTSEWKQWLSDTRAGKQPPLPAGH